jgi:hypothetical protein
VFQLGQWGTSHANLVTDRHRWSKCTEERRKDLSRTRSRINLCGMWIVLRSRLEQRFECPLACRPATLTSLLRIVVISSLSSGECCDSNSRTFPTQHSFRRHITCTETMSITFWAVVLCRRLAVSQRTVTRHGPCPIPIALLHKPSTSNSPYFSSDDDSSMFLRNVDTAK